MATCGQSYQGALAINNKLGGKPIDHRLQTECYAQIGGCIAASLFFPSIHMITLDHGTPFEPQAPELRVLNVVGLGPEERQHAVWITEQPGAGNLHVFLLNRSQMGEESC